MLLQLSPVIIHPVFKLQTVFYIEETHKLALVIFQDILPGGVNIYFNMLLRIQRYKYIPIHADDIRPYYLFNVI